MIVTIACRHKINAKINRDQVARELRSLSKYDESITRSQAIFSKETHHKNADNLITCHLSIYIPNKHQVDIYGHQPTEAQAFDRARERAVKQITRNCFSTKRMPPIRLSSIAQINSGVY